MSLIRITNADLVLLQQGKMLTRIGGPSINIVLVDGKGQTAEEALDAIFSRKDED